MSEKLTIGWREWASLPALGIERIKMKVDTGARTSALHAFFVEPFDKDGELWVRFSVHPEQENNDLQANCEARVKDRRTVRDSGGHEEMRYVIETQIKIGEAEFPAEVTLTDRDTMKFRALLGRTAMHGRFLVDPQKSYSLSQEPIST